MSCERICVDWDRTTENELEQSDINEPLIDTVRGNSARDAEAWANGIRSTKERNNDFVFVFITTYQISC